MTYRPFIVWLFVSFLISLFGCYRNIQYETVLLRINEDSVEVLNADSLSVVPPRDSLALDEIPQPILTVNPTYPEDARRAGLEGTVWVKLWVTKTGNVRKGIVLSTTEKAFNQPALRAAVLWQFRPAVVEGQRTACWVAMPFRFHLRNR